MEPRLDLPEERFYGTFELALSQQEIDTERRRAVASGIALRPGDLRASCSPSVVVSSRTPWAVVRFEVVTETPAELDMSTLVFVRGLTWAMMFLCCDAVGGRGVPTRLFVPPRQNLTLEVLTPSCPLVVRVGWARYLDSNTRQPTDAVIVGPDETR